MVPALTAVQLLRAKLVCDVHKALETAADMTQRALATQLKQQ
jgi:hypothetical protein